MKYLPDLSALFDGIRERFREEIAYGDHVLHCEHEEDAGNITIIVFCESCFSESALTYPRKSVDESNDFAGAFFLLFRFALKDFALNTVENCAEAGRMNVCKEVLES